MKHQGTIWLCNKCKCMEFIPDKEFGIKTSQITRVMCPKCICKGKRIKMVKQQ